MAEGWVRHLKKGVLEAASAGVDPKGIDPMAVKVMAEAGVNISDQISKDMDTFRNTRFDYVVTLCDRAKESCPFFPGETRQIHKGFDDPPSLSSGLKDEEEILSPYRRVRDEIRAFVEGMPEVLDLNIKEG
jgi:arsenate reductase